MQEAPSKGNVRVLCLEKKKEKRQERPLHEENERERDNKQHILGESHKSLTGLQFTSEHVLFCIKKMKLLS